jgi:anti-sigma factor RsiW
MWDYLDGRLSREAANTVRAHIAACPPCRDYQAFQERIREAEAALRPRRAAPPDLAARIREAIRKER